MTHDPLLGAPASSPARKDKPTRTSALPGGTPRLRFPEFRDGPEWDRLPMGEVYSFKGNNSLSRDQLNYEAGSVKNIHYGDIHTRFSTLFDITRETVPYINDFELLNGFRTDDCCVEGDMIFADASEDLADIGKSMEIVRLHGARVVAGQHTILARPNDSRLAVGFGAYLFKSRYVRIQIQKESQGSKVLGISAKRLTKIELPIPTSKIEQQKIAECLSTLDELIRAESQKLDALKAHKKGLMQQLFPREGETIPRLRFPEFRDTGDWDMKKLDDLVDFQSGGTPSKANSTFWNGSIPWVSAKDMKYMFLEDSEDRISAAAVDDGAKLVPSGTLLMLVRGMTLLKDVPICVVCRDMSFNQDVKALRPINGVVGLFLVWLLTSAKGRLLEMVAVAGHGTGKLDTDELKAMDLMLPSSCEQHRIATCLSSLDELIAAQSDRISALQAHKQGLLQQLFPTPAEDAV